MHLIHSGLSRFFCDVYAFQCDRFGHLQALHSFSLIVYNVDSVIISIVPSEFSWFYYCAFDLLGQHYRLSTGRMEPMEFGQQLYVGCFK
jgi:hypothetical protein